MATTVNPTKTEVLVKVERICPVVEQYREESETRRRISDEVSPP